MRITNSMLINNMINYMGRNLERLDTYQSQLATGKKITVPADDPIVAARALKLRTDVSMVDQYKSNLKDAQSWIDTTETSLANVGDILQRARELAVSGSNGTLTLEDKEKISTEVEQLKQQLVKVANTTYAGRYIFSGYKTDKKLLNEDGTFNIEIEKSEKIRYEIGVSDDMNINVPGCDLFNNGASVNELPAKSSLIQDFNDFVDALGTKATYTGSDLVPLVKQVPFDATQFTNMQISFDGNPPVSINLTDSTAGLIPPPVVSAMSTAQIIAEMNADIGTAGTASIGSDGRIQVISSTIGPGSSVAVVSSPYTNILFGIPPVQVDGTATTAGTFTSFKDMPPFMDVTGFNDISLTFDSTTTVTVNLTDNTAAAAPIPDITQMTPNQIAAEIQADIGALGTAQIVNNRLVITSATTGVGSSVQVNLNKNSNTLFQLSRMSVQGTQYAEGRFTGENNLNEPVFDATAYNPPIFNIKLDGINRTINLVDNTADSDVVDVKAMTLEQVVAEINADIATYGAASIVDGKLRISSATGGDASSVEVQAVDRSILTALFGTDPVLRTGKDLPTHGAYTGGTDISAIDPSSFAPGQASIDITLDGKTPPITVNLITATSTADVINTINASLTTLGSAVVIDSNGITYARATDPHDGVEKWINQGTGAYSTTLSGPLYLKISSGTWGSDSKVDIAPTVPPAPPALPGDDPFTDALLGTGSASTSPPLIMPGSNGFDAEISTMITAVDKQITNLLIIRSDIGARTNRLDLTSNRLDSDELNFTKLMSNNEDVDTAEVIMKLKSEENVYQASLSGGARVIQPTLVDFLK